MKNTASIILKKIPFLIPERCRAEICFRQRQSLRMPVAHHSVNLFSLAVSRAVVQGWPALNKQPRAGAC